MLNTNHQPVTRLVFLTMALVLWCHTNLIASGADEAARILTETGVQGGLILHLGCGDGQLTTALHAGDGYLVHGLDTDPENVAKSAARIRELGLYATVTVDTFDGATLPVIDNTVNLIVATDRSAVPQSELIRALAPCGVAYINGSKIVKPRPENIDDWTHYLHDASNNAVAHDDVIGPPRHLQWQCGPLWSRHHDHMASISGLVTSGGRVFYIIDEGSRVSPQLPPNWKLVARDAFSGVLLWKLPIDHWFDALWPLKSGPTTLPRRLVAIDGKVFVTLGIDAPVTALDAATGRPLQTFAGTSGAEELILHNNLLIVLVHRTPLDPATDLARDVEEGKSRDSRTTYSEKMKQIWAEVRSTRWANADRSVLAIDANSGDVRWTLDSRVMPLTLSADAKHVYFHDGERILAITRSTGAPAWSSETVPVWRGLEGQGTQSWFAPTLVVQDSHVLFAGGEKTHMSYMGWGAEDIGEDTMTAFDAATGKKLWTAPHPFSGYNSPEDLFVIKGRVWTGKTAKGGPDGRYFGRDLNTGTLDVEFPPTVNAHWFHHRCYRAKATDRFVLCSRTGIEFVDLETGDWTINHWVRGGCLYGIMPANGLIYAPSHPCACYSESKLNGFVALAPARKQDAARNGPVPEGPEGPRQVSRLEIGSAYGKAGSSEVKVAEPVSARRHIWPTYRSDAARSGATSESVASRVQPLWKTSLGGRLTQPIFGNGLLYVADSERHLVHGLDITNGQQRWTFHAGGRVDSSPTFFAGQVIFGCNDGYVYCLRASDGQLAWRFRAAPEDRRMVAFDCFESVWPVHGSVLVQDGIVSLIAGRSMFLDGGLRACRLDATTGRLLSEVVLDDRIPETGADLQTEINGLNMPVALPDILSSDGNYLFMRSQVLDLEGNRVHLGPSGSGHKHLFAPYGFTDDSWFHRTYWLYGDRFSGGVGGFGNGKTNPAGRILVNNQTTVFGYGRKPQYYRWGSAIDYQLFAASMPESDNGPAVNRAAARNPAAAANSAAAAKSAELIQGILFGKAASLDPTGRPLTIAAWVRSKGPNGTILVRGANACGFALILTDGRPRMLLRAKGKTHEVMASERLADGWAHVAGVLHQDGQMEVYVNGNVAGVTHNVPLPDRNPQIGMKVGFDDTHQLLPEPLVPLTGSIDEVRLFHRALAADEIAQLADIDVPDTLDLKDQVLHLDFTRGKLRDRSASENHGQATGTLATMAGPIGEALVLDQPPSPSQIAVSRRGEPTKNSPVRFLWTRDVPLMVRAMALAGDTLLIAGPKDVLDEDAAFQTFDDDATQKQLLIQDAVLRGETGAVFQIVDAVSGATLSEQQLDSPPVFDGLSISGGRVFLATMDGQILCLGP